MKKMKIEKQLIFADNVKKVVAMDVQEGLTYTHEDDGIRALGPLHISGTYEGNEGIENFQETLEMDVLAPNEKLNGEPFSLAVAQYLAEVSEEGILLLITIDIHGIKEGKETQKATTIPQETVIVPPVLSSTVDNAKVFKNNTNEKRSEKEIPVVANIEEEAIENNAVDDFNDLFSDAESTYTSYRIIVAKHNDSYHDIADRYDVDEIALRDTNKNKDIYPKTLVILPFQQK